MLVCVYGGFADFMKTSTNTGQAAGPLPAIVVAVRRDGVQKEEQECLKGLNVDAEMVMTVVVIAFAIVVEVAGVKRKNK